MKSFDPKSLPTPVLHEYLVSTVAPRPIAFVSTVAEDGTPNLAPYSFFNVFSSNPPTLVFSSNRRVEDNTTKDTLHNVEKTGEVVINAVSHAIVRQMAVASVQFEAGVDEFVKSGLTPVPSEVVRPFRVKESPVNFECKVKQIIRLGDGGGAGHLIICEIVWIHLADHIFDEENRIDPDKIDLVARMGRAFYARASGDAVFKVFQPVPKLVIGVDSLPIHIRQSKILTGNDLGQLGGLFEFPTEEAVKATLQEPEIQQFLRQASDIRTALHQYAKAALEREDTVYAFKVLLLEPYL